VQLLNEVSRLASKLGGSFLLELKFCCHLNAQRNKGTSMLVQGVKMDKAELKCLEFEIGVMTSASLRKGVTRVAWPRSITFAVMI
jgi:hypothetical protein